MTRQLSSDDGRGRSRRMVAASYLLAAFTLAGAATPIAWALPGDEAPATFLKLQADWAEARKKGDMAFLERFYAKEFTVGNMNGAEATRAQDLGMFSSGDLKPSVITDDEMKVNVYGQAALVTGVEHLEGSYKGHTGSFDLRFANVYVYRDQRWQLVRHQATPIVKR
jgi:ketosteroid isomerase-like protein